MSTDLFKGRKLIIATKHKKENVIAPLIEKALGVECVVPEDFDTDNLGTFTGEVERTLDPVAAARKKCTLAMELAGYDLGIASEGSFGPHPSLIFQSADDEFLILIDKLNDLEIIVRELSSDTNFNGKQISSEKELLEFAHLVKFPSHKIILRSSKHNTEHIHKDIQNLSELKAVFNSLAAAYAETDMRAMNNPSRMAVIKTATQKLVAKIKNCCPECNAPGLGVTEVKSGLKCGLCGSPTKSTLSHISQCQHCDFTKEELYPHKKTEEEPTYCDYCNP